MAPCVRSKRTFLTEQQWHQQQHQHRESSLVQDEDEKAEQKTAAENGEQVELLPLALVCDAIYYLPVLSMLTTIRFTSRSK